MMSLKNFLATGICSVLLCAAVMGASASPAAHTSGTYVTTDDWPELKGPYLGQKTPGMTPEVFAPNIISLPDYRELNAVFSNNGNTFMFSREINGVFKMFYSRRRQDSTWTQPQMAAPSKTYPNHRDVDMMFSPDDKWLYFISDRPLKGYSLSLYNIWRSRWGDYGLEAPEPLGANINGPTHEFYPMIVGDGSLYFSAQRPNGFGENDEYRAQIKPDGSFEDPVNLGPAINTKYGEGDIYVSPDESFLVFTSGGRPDGLGSSDLYISFKQEDGSWGAAKHMGPKFNSDVRDYCPMVSRDGKFFFFTRGDDLMWVDIQAVMDLAD